MPKQVKESKRLQAKRAAASKRQQPLNLKKNTPAQILQAKIAELRASGEADPAVIAVLQARLEDMLSPASVLAAKEIAGKAKLRKKLGRK